MFLASRMLFVYTETPLHAGTGAGLGAVDLPIQRERITGYPIVQASGIKGTLRSEANGGGQESAELIAAFGHKDAEHAGAFSPGDARILLFPVRSLAGVFAWTTSYSILARFFRDALIAGYKTKELPELPNNKPEKNEALASGSRVLVNTENGEQTAVLEEFAFNATIDETAKKWAKWLAEKAIPDSAEYIPWKTYLQDGLLILPEEDFRDFVLNSTEVITRVRLEPENKTVVSGALWTEEHLPTDSLLYTLVHATKLRVKGDKPKDLAKDTPKQEANEIINWVEKNVPHRIQLGGDETVGRGIVRLRWNGGAS